MSAHTDILKRHGIDPVQLATKLNLMYLITDMADGYATEVEQLLKWTGAYRNADKQNVRAVKHHTAKLVNGVSATLGGTSPLSEGFGELSDFLREVIEIACHAKEDQRIKVISTIKMIVK